MFKGIAGHIIIAGPRGHCEYRYKLSRTWDAALSKRKKAPRQCKKRRRQLTFRPGTFI